MCFVALRCVQCVFITYLVKGLDNLEFGSTSFLISDTEVRDTVMKYLHENLASCHFSLKKQHVDMRNELCTRTVRLKLPRGLGDW